MLNGMNLKIVSVAMAVAMAIAAVSAVGVLTSMSFVQEANAQCEEIGNPDAGATVTKCDLSPFGINQKFTRTDTPSGNINGNIHLKP
jgi:hypothetical protein